jgi:hypothetical protein
MTRREKVQGDKEEVGKEQKKKGVGDVIFMLRYNNNCNQESEST